MVLSILSNSAASVAQRNMQLTERSVERTFTRISSGQRVFSAREDAASLAIGTGLRIDVAALRSAQINAATGVSTLQVADGGLGEIASLLSRMGALASQAQNEAISDTERGFLDNEYQLLKEEVSRITAQTQFNGQPLLGGASGVGINTQGANVDAAAGFAAFELDPDKVAGGDQFTVEYDASIGIMRLNNVTQGRFQDVLIPAGPAPGFTSSYNFGDLGVQITFSSAFNAAASIGNPPIGVAPGPGATETFDTVATATAVPATLEFQIGPGTAAADRIQVTLPLVTLSGLGLATTDITSRSDAEFAFQQLELAVDSVSASRAQLGANLSRMEAAISSIDVAVENTEAARSRMLDANVAEEASNLASQQVLLQAGAAILAQANQRPEVLLRLLEA